MHRARPIPLKDADVNENAKRMAKDTYMITDKYNLLAAGKYEKLHGNAIHVSQLNVLLMIFPGK